jgi:phage terminase large subunit
MKLPACADWLLANGVKLPDIAVGGSESVQLMRRFKEANIPARGGTHEIVEGIKIVRRLIKDGNGYRALKVAPRCKNLIGELTQGYRYPDNARRDSEKPEDANNHGADALRLWLYMRAR